MVFFFSFDTVILYKCIIGKNWNYPFISKLYAIKHVEKISWTATRIGRYIIEYLYEFQTIVFSDNVDITIYKTDLFHPNSCQPCDCSVCFLNEYLPAKPDRTILAAKATNNNKDMRNSGTLNNIFAINTMPRQTFAPACVAIIDDGTRWQL